MKANLEFHANGGIRAKKEKLKLVARGFEESVHTARTDSPTCSRQSLRLCFVTCATMKWAINSLDVTSAFLQGNGINGKYSYSRQLKQNRRDAVEVAKMYLWA